MTFSDFRQKVKWKHKLTVNVITFASDVCLQTVNLSTGTGQFIVQQYSDGVQIDRFPGVNMYLLMYAWINNISVA